VLWHAFSHTPTDQPLNSACTCVFVCVRKLGPRRVDKARACILRSISACSPVSDRTSRGTGSSFGITVIYTYIYCVCREEGREREGVGGREGE